MKNLTTKLYESLIQERLIGGPSDGGISDIVKELPTYNLYSLSELKHELKGHDKCLRFSVNDSNIQYVKNIEDNGDYILFVLSNDENDEVTDLSNRLLTYKQHNYWTVSPADEKEKKYRVYSVRTKAPEARGGVLLTITSR